MITEKEFEKIKSRAKTFKHNSFEYLDFEGCADSAVLENGEDLIFLLDSQKSPQTVNFAFDSFEKFASALSETEGELRINFVPHEFVKPLEAMGFEIFAEFMDFFNRDLAKTAVKNTGGLKFLTKEECGQAAEVSQKCAYQSRGFTGETAEWFESWLGENDVLTEKIGGKIAGFCCVSVYSEGTTLWVREIAVEPERQGKGIGGKLIRQALAYGMDKGAKKAFLAADVKNGNAIGLYKKYGFEPREDDSEIQMVRRNRS